MNLRQKAAKGVAWSAIENLGTQAIYFVVFLVLARLLQPEAFGLVSLAGVFISFMMVFADQGLSDAIVQRQELAFSLAIDVAKAFDWNSMDA